MRTIQQFGYNLYVLYNLCIIYIYNQVSIFLLNHGTSLKNLAAWCEMELSSMSRLLDILQNLYLWSQFLQRAQAGHSAVDLVSGLTWTINEGNYRERVYLGLINLNHKFLNILIMNREWFIFIKWNIKWRFIIIIY